jgi:hypothetical protein
MPINEILENDSDVFFVLYNGINSIVKIFVDRYNIMIDSSSENIKSMRSISE